MPGGNNKWFKQEETLQYDEIVRLVWIMTHMGIDRIRLTGGEPLIRPRIEDLIAALSKFSRIKKISMTSNGLLLRDKVKALKDAGLQSMNISLDTFNPSRFKSITGIDGLSKVLAAIKSASDVGLEIKINTVIVRGWNDDEVVDFANFAKETGYQVRFIEFMPLDGSGIWSHNLVFSKNEMIYRINKEMGKLTRLGSHNDDDDGNNPSSDPAVLYSFADKTGIIGFIPSITEPFCNKCDRIRITSDGRLLTCLYENPGYDLKNLLRGMNTDEQIARYIAECMMKKPEGIISMIRSKTLRPSLNRMHTIGG
jgi:cyclic pyranopterin phosphate synthase